MHGWIVGLAAFFGLPLGVGLIFFVTVPESRPRFYEAGRNDWRRVKGRVRHPLTRQGRSTTPEQPWDGWAP